MIYGPVCAELNPRTPGQLFKMSLMLNNDPRFGGGKQMELSGHARHPPNSGLLPAPSISVQLLVWPLKVSSCDLSSPPAAALELNTVSIQSVIFTLLGLEGGDVSLMCLCHDCGVEEQPGDKVMAYCIQS